MKTGRQILEEIVSAVAGKDNVVTYVKIENSPAQLRDRKITHIWEAEGIRAGQKIEHMSEGIFKEYLIANNVNPLKARTDELSSRSEVFWEEYAGIRLGGKVTEEFRRGDSMIEDYAGLDGFNKEYVETNSLFTAFDVARKLLQIFRDFDFKQKFAEGNREGLEIKDMMLAEVVGAGDRYDSFRGYHRQQEYAWGFFLVPRTPIELFCGAAEKAFNMTTVVPRVSYFIETPIMWFEFPFHTGLHSPVRQYGYQFKETPPLSNKCDLKTDLNALTQLFENVVKINSVLSTNAELTSLLNFYEERSREVTEVLEKFQKQQECQRGWGTLQQLAKDQTYTYLHNILFPS